MQSGSRAAGSGSHGPTLFALSGLLALQFALRWPFRAVPLVRDEGEYAHLGQEILRGALPYLDVYNQKTPFVFYWMAGCLEAFGGSIEALRLATTGWSLASTVVVFAVARALFSDRAALFAAAAFALMSFDQCGVVHSASSECFGLPWIAAGAGLWLGRGAGGTARCVAAGAFAGLAYQTKQTGIVLLLFFAAEAAWRLAMTGRGEETLPRAARQTGLAALGFAAVLAATLAFFAAQGGLGAYWEATWTHNLEYVGRREIGLASVPARVAHILASIARWDVGFWAIGAAGLGVLAIRTPRSRASGLWLLLGATAGGAFSAGKLYAHYWEPLIVPLALGTGVACGALLDSLRSSQPAWSRSAAALLLLAPWLWPVAHGFTLLRDPSAELRRVMEPLYPAELAPAVGAWLAQHTEPGEAVLVIGSEPQIYFYADRPAASAMAHTYTLTGPYRFARELRERFVTELRESGPRYVVMVWVPTSLSEFPERAAAFAQEVRRVLDRHYQVEREFAPTRAAPGPQRRARLSVYRRLEV